MANLIKFYRGAKNKYSSSAYADCLYFATDTHELLMNNISFGGGGITEIKFEDGKIKITFVDGSTKECAITEASSTASGLMSIASFNKLSALPTRAELTTEINNVDKKIGIADFTGGSEHIKSCTDATQAINALDRWLDDVETGYVNKNEKGAANGVAPLDENAKLKPQYLYGQSTTIVSVNMGYANEAAIPDISTLAANYIVWANQEKILKKVVETGGVKSWEVLTLNTDDIYYFLGSDKTGDTSRTKIQYKWNGEDLVEIGGTIVIGETTGTAYDGGKGKANRDAIKSFPQYLISNINSTEQKDSVLTLKYTASKQSADGMSRDTTLLDFTTDLPAATTTGSGVMSKEDKLTLDAIYTYAGSDKSNINLLQKNNAGVGIIKDYVVQETASALTQADTINVALGKLEKYLKDLIGTGTGSIDTRISTAINSLINGASEDYNTLYKIQQRIADVKALIDIINGEATVEGSIKKALADAKAYTDTCLQWYTLGE